jgi:hypothetical protein
MSSVCENELAPVGDDDQLNYKAEYVRLTRLLAQKEVCCFFLFWHFVINSQCALF